MKHKLALDTAARTPHGPVSANNSDWLTRILAQTRLDLAQGHVSGEPVPDQTHRRSTPARSLAAALRRPHLGLIAEYKPRSPSASDVVGTVSPADFATAITPVAAAVSVLVDGPFFGGSFALLREIAAQVPQPVLAKGFFIDEYQLDLAVLSGADAVLLVAEALPGPALAAMITAAHARGLEVLAEAHSAHEATRVAASQADVVGVNARSLRDLHIDLHAAVAILARLDANVPRIAESGVASAADVTYLRQQQQAGLLHGVLVGTALYSAHSDPSTRVADSLRALGLS